MELNSLRNAMKPMVISKVRIGIGILEISAI